MSYIVPQDAIDLFTNQDRLRLIETLLKSLEPYSVGEDSDQGHDLIKAALTPVSTMQQTVKKKIRHGYS